MRRLASEKKLNADEYLATSLGQDIDYIQIMKAKRERVPVLFELAQVRFLKKEAKRLGWSRNGVIRGIVNMYMEGQYVLNKAAKENGDLEYWMHDKLGYAELDKESDGN